MSVVTCHFRSCSHGPVGRSSLTPKIFNCPQGRGYSALTTATETAPGFCGGDAALGNHRGPGVILSADQIVVMDQGHIKEIGTHSELLEKSGYYRRLFDMQFNRDGEGDGLAEDRILVDAIG